MKIGIGCVLNPLADLMDPGQYSLSTFEKPIDVKRFAGVISDMKIPYQIAVGETNPRHGLVQRTKERTKKKLRMLIGGFIKTHHHMMSLK